MTSGKAAYLNARTSGERWVGGGSIRSRPVMRSRDSCLTSCGSRLLRCTLCMLPAAQQGTGGGQQARRPYISQRGAQHAGWAGSKHLSQWAASSMRGKMHQSQLTLSVLQRRSAISDSFAAVLGGLASVQRLAASWHCNSGTTTGTAAAGLERRGRDRQRPGGACS